MKKIFNFLVCLALILGLGGIAFAQFDRENADEAGYVNTYVATTDTAAAVARPCYIYGVQFYAAASTSYVNIYDAATATGEVRIEVSEATAGDWTYYRPAKPVKFDTSVSIDLTGSGAIAIIEYR